jgi:hypothetical protein
MYRADKKDAYLLSIRIQVDLNYRSCSVNAIVECV